jgi:lysozyme
MKPRHRVSRAAIELIARFEGYRRKAARLPDGRWTIGYGHTLTAREGAEVSPDDAEALLLYDLIAVAHAINEHVYAPLTQNQFDALASFVFNIGVEAFLASAVLKRLNEGALIQAACAMELWRKAEFAGEVIVIDALVRRRAAEKALFLTPPDGWPVAPTPVLKPRLDRDAERLVPGEAPAPVTATLEGESVRVLRDEAPTPAPLPPEEEGPSPVLAAAEAVASRLQTIFAEPETPPEQPEPPFRLEAPAEAEPERPELLAHPPEEPEGPPSGELFPEAPPTGTPAAAAEAVGQTETARVLIDDTAPFEFRAAIVQPLPAQPRGGPFMAVLLAVVGMAFIGGGLFWAANGQAGVGYGVFTPLFVGWLAGLAGVGLLSVAVFLLLRGMGGSGED